MAISKNKVSATKAVKKEAVIKVAKPKVSTDKKTLSKSLVNAEVSVSKKTTEKTYQAVRVYLANQRQGNASTKTRGEVDGSTAKIYRQKGTGRARHGSKRAPIFVKGGIVFGPKPRDFSLELPQKMKRKALFSALSAKVKDNEVIVIDGLGGIKPKTKVFAEVLEKLGVAKKKQKLLFVTAGKDVSLVLRSGRNVQGVSFLPSKQVNAYQVLVATRLVLMKDAIDEMKEHFLKK